MISHDERLDYYLMVTRLMAEADAQLDVDAADPAALPYGEELAALREAVRTAEEAAARIVVMLVSSKRAHKGGEGNGLAARH